MMVRFATVCDVCQERSEEYTSWPSCRECYEDICPACAAPGTLIDADLDQPATVLCSICANYLAGDLDDGHDGL